MEFFMPMKPPTATAQERAVRVVGGKPRFYETAEVKKARALLLAHLAKHRPGKPMRGAVRLAVKWCFPRGRHRDGEYRVTRPDTDNLQKLLKDCMTAVGFWKDDAQVVCELCEKFWAEIPGIYIDVQEIASSKDLVRLGCGTCEWHDDFSGACGNGESPFRADFTDDDCACFAWEMRSTIPGADLREV